MSRKLIRLLKWNKKITAAGSAVSNPVKQKWMINWDWLYHNSPLIFMLCCGIGVVLFIFWLLF